MIGVCHHYPPFLLFEQKSTRLLHHAFFWIIESKKKSINRTPVVSMHTLSAICILQTCITKISTSLYFVLSYQPRRRMGSKIPLRLYAPINHTSLCRFISLEIFTSKHKQEIASVRTLCPLRHITHKTPLAPISSF